MKKATLNTIKLAEISIVSNTRTFINESDQLELINSIAEKGVLQPLGVLKLKDGKYRLIYGERRFKACLEVQKTQKTFTSVPVQVFEKLTEDEILELQITENLQRKDISPMEEATAFLQLMNTKKYKIEEIAKRVGKSVSFVNSRLRLNDLIEPFKQAVASNRLTLTSAYKITVLATASQNELWDEEFSEYDSTDEIEVSERLINQYLSNLSNAVFDIKDKTLNNIACTNCPFNSACNTSLFPEDEKKAVCTNNSCFKEKTEAHYKLMLNRALNNPSMCLVNGEYYRKTELILELEKEGHKVYPSNEIQTFEMPLMPKLTEFKSDLQNGDYENEDEMKIAFEEAKIEYEKEVAEYEHLLDSGELMKGYLVEGRDKGTYIEFIERLNDSDKPKKSLKDFKEKQQNNDLSENDIDDEKNRLFNNEVRKKELDEEKTQPLFYDAFAKIENYTCKENALLKAEEIGLILLLIENGGYYLDKDLKLNYDDLMGFDLDALSLFRNKLTRAVLQLKLRPKAQERPSRSDNAKVLIDILEQYDSKSKNQIWENQLLERTKREEKLTAKIEELTAQLIKINKLQNVA